MLVAGKEVPMSLEELVDPATTALVIVDIQNDYCATGGRYDKAGKDMSPYPAMIRETGALLGAARDRGVMRVFIQNLNRLDYRYDSPAQLRFKLHLRGVDPERLPETEHAIEGSWGYAIVDELTPRDDEPVVRKFRSSAFAGTELSLLLTSNGIRQVVVCGVVTEGCLMSSAYHAHAEDFVVVLAEDCVGSGNPEAHEHALALMRLRFDTYTAADIVKAWSA